MPYNLKGRNVLVTGGSRGLGADVCRAFAAEGANIAINYVNSEKAAQDLEKELQKHNVKTSVIKGDATNMDDCRRCVQDTVKALGGIDILICNAGWTRFSDFNNLDSMSDEEWNRCWNAQVLGPKNCLQEALPHFQKNSDGGVCLITGSIAGQSLGGSSMPYSVTKAAQIHFMKCVAKTQGPKLRINVVLPGLLLTDWGNLYGEERINFLKEAAVLKQETLLDDCANMFVTLAKNTSVTGQAYTVDSGINIANM